MLDGSCGVAECCGVTARIEIGRAAVRWSVFNTHGRAELPAGLEFIFDRAEYERAIVADVNLEPTTWTLRDR